MTRRAGIIVTTASAAVLAAITAIGFALFPHIADDLYSANFLREAYLHGAAPDWHSYFAAAENILRTNHFRLCNLLMPLIILLPRWIPAAVSGGALMVIYLLSARIGRFDSRPTRFALYALALAVCYPWPDQLYLTSFQLPYLWGPTAALWLLWMIWRGKGNPAALGLVGYLLGFWHELVAGAVLAAIVAGCLRYLAMRRATSVAAAVGLALGIGTVALSFIFNRSGGGFAPPAIHSASTFVFLLPAAVYTVGGIARRRNLDKPGFCLWAATAASTVLCLYFCVGPRITAFGTLCALAGLMRMLPAQPLLGARIGATLACVTMAGLPIHYAAVDVMCARLGRQTRFVLQKYTASPGSTIYAPMTLREDAPAMLLGKPYYDWWAHTRGRAVFEWMYGRADEPILAVPEELSDFDPQQATRIDGSAGMYLWRGHTVAQAPTDLLLSADYGLGASPRWYSFVPFFTAGDGNVYLWLHPERLGIDYPGFHSPRRIDLIEQASTSANPIR